MKKKYIILVITMLLLIGVYFLFFHKDKTLKYIPENADVVVLIDIKKTTRQYISSFLTHPSKWFEEDQSGEKKKSISDSGIKIPDYLQIFHLKKTKISEWYTILEINDKDKLSAFLKNRKFISDGKYRFKNGQLFVKIEGESCIVGTSAAGLNEIKNALFQKFRNRSLSADSFMDNGLGSISLLSELRTQNFSLDLNDDEIVIKNASASENFALLIADLQNKTQFLNAELDKENIKNFSLLFNSDLTDSADINYLKLSADLEEVNDTIIGYGYDDNFNEIEKISYQKIVQPDYEISLQSANPQKTWNYFQNRKWINAQNQFTAIPFQPNLIIQNKNEIVIKSIKKKNKLNQYKKQNYIFIKNNPLLYNSLKNLMGSDKSFIKDIEYFFYSNNGSNYHCKIKFVRKELPLILR